MLLVRLLRTSLLLMAALSVDRCQGAPITLTYDPVLGPVIPNLDLGQTTLTAQVDLLRATSPRLDDVDFHLSPFIVPASILTSGNFTTTPIAVTSMCLATTVGNSTGFTLKQLGAAMSGTPSASMANIQWFIAPPSISPSSASLLQALVLNGIAPFTSTTAWPSSVLSNPNVQLLADGASVSAALTNCPNSMWCIGPQLSYASWAASLPCLRVRRTVNVTGDTISYSNRLTASTMPYIIVDPEHGTAYSQGPVYPFIGGIYLSARRAVSCDVMDGLSNMLTAFFTNASNSAALESQGLQPVSTTVGYMTLNTLQSLSGTNCSSNIFTASIKGDSNLYDAMASLNYDSYSNNNYMVGFGIGTTAAVLADVYSAQTLTHTALVEGVPSTTQRAANPAITIAPVFAHGLALVYTLDGRDGLVASPCTMLGMLNGTIQYWDDPALKTDNVGFQLPHVKITRIMSYDGSQEAAGRGVTYIARRCGLTIATSFKTYPFATDVSVAARDVVVQVQNLEGAIGLAPTSSAIAASMNQLAILFPSQLQVSGTVDDVAAVMAQSTINLTTNAVRFPARTVDYFPFVAIVYAVVDTDAEDGCDAYVQTLNWLTYVVGPSASNVLTNTYQVVLGDSFSALVTAAIASTKCDGVVLFPIPMDPILWWPYAVVSAVAFALFAVVGARAVHRYGILSARPTDPTKPIAVMFVGIKNQAAVLEAGEENAAAAHTRVAETVRRLVRKHGCYEARRIDAATTMIVAKDATRAAACAEDIVLTLSIDVPWLEAVMTHPMPQRAKKLRHRNSSRRSDPPSARRSDPTSARRSNPNNSNPGTPSGIPRTDSSKGTPLKSASPPGMLRSISSPSAFANRRPASEPNLRHTPSELNAPATPLSKTSDMHTATQTSTTTALTLQQCVPEVYAGLHWTNVMIDVQDEIVSYHGTGITTAACIADLAVGGQIVVSREFMDCLTAETVDHHNAEYHFAMVGDGKSSDHLVGMSLTTPRFPDWLVAQAAMRRKSIEEKGKDDGNMIAAAMASADGVLAKRRIAAVSMLVEDLVTEGADGRATVVGETLAELLDIVASNRGQIHSITDGVVTATVGAGAPVAMAAVRAAQIAMEASELCVAIGVNSGSAMVGNAMGGKPATVGRVVAAAALMRLVAGRAGVRICATDVSQADLAAKFELATVDLIATPWDLSKHVRCLCVAEERAQAEEGEWMYEMNDGFEQLERRLDHYLSAPLTATIGETGDALIPPAALPQSSLLDRHEAVVAASDELYHALLPARSGNFVQELTAARLSSLGSHALTCGTRASIL